MIERTTHNDIELISFGNETKAERKLLKQFVNYHLLILEHKGFIERKKWTNCTYCYLKYQSDYYL